MNTLAEFVQRLRKKRGLTQEFLASELDISRPTYSQIELGERDLTITEAKKLADVFGIDFNNFLQNKEEVIVVKLKKDKAKTKTERQEIRISVPQKNLKKFKEVLLYVLSKVGGKSNVGEAVLYKLLYFIDFDFYEKFEKQLVGATYIKNHYGPTPVEFKAVVDDMIRNGEIMKVEGKYFNYLQRKYLAVRRASLDLLSGCEIEHIDDVLARLSDKNAKEMENYSHGDIPWKVAEDGKPLSYESVFYRDEYYSVRNYEDEL
ncbi:MAG: type II toxin-antitoxin system antitoxin SocA domain-containing protein [Patescibacteria group bacterium]